MNCTKFIPPLENFVSFYYYFSYFTLFLTLSITPLTFFIILTQSKNLKSFKWLILNHSFWCLIFEVLFTTVKPLYFSPLSSGIPLGLIKNGSFKLTLFTTYLILIIAATSVFALGSTLLCRYLLVFPSTTWFTKKRGITFTVTYLIISYGILSILFYPLFNIDEKEVYKMAFKVEPCLQNFIEPGFLFVPYEIGVITLFGGFSMLIGILCFAITLAIYFIYLVKTNISVNSKAIKLSNSLMISAIFQLSVSIFFNFIPLSIFMGILAFKIPFTENLMIINFCFLSMHSFLEFFATLYCVTPYRKAVVKIFYYFIRCKNHSIENNPGQISVILSEWQSVARLQLTDGHQTFRRQPLTALNI